MNPADIAEAAYFALTAEVNATPKPGLVDREGNGSHKDMDIACFMKSAQALRPYFLLMAEEGARGGEDMLPRLRRIGFDAEKAMYEATGGVNTHKGAIFSIGLICAACALADSGDTEKICKTCAELVDGISRELGADKKTHGQKAYAACGAAGARGEAESGFHSVRSWGIPVYEASLAAGDDDNMAAVKALISLIANVDDTNVITRGGAENALWVREEAHSLLSSFSLEGVRAFGKKLERYNISPGGCADLLAATILLNKMRNIKSGGDTFGRGN